MAIVIRRLEELDEVENFDCGDDALNNYLKRHAWPNQEKSSIGVSYAALDEDAPRTVLGYFTLAMASVPRDAFPRKYVRGLPSLRFAPDLAGAARRGSAIRRPGTWTRPDFRGLPHQLTSRRRVGCRCIITDAYRDRVGWYARYGFVPIEGAAESGPQRMFLDMRTVHAALRR